MNGNGGGAVAKAKATVADKSNHDFFLHYFIMSRANVCRPINWVRHLSSVALAATVTLMTVRL